MGTESRTEATHREKTGSPLADEMPRIAHVIALANQAGILDRLPVLLNHCSTVQELRTVIRFLEAFFLTPPEAHPTFLNELRETIVSRPGGDEREAQEAVARFFDQTSGKIGPTVSGEFPEGPKICPTQPTVSNFLPEGAGGKGSTRLTATEPGGRGVSEDPKGIAPETGVTPRITQRPVQETRSPEKIVMAMIREMTSQPVGTDRGTMILFAQTLVQKIFALKEPVQREAVIKNLLMKFCYPNSRVRLLVVSLLRELARSRSREVFDKFYLGTLKALCRQTWSAEVQSEAIQVLLDMGGQHGRDREEMEKLFQEIELTRLLDRLLRSPERREVEKGLALLGSIERWLPLKMRVKYAELMTERVLEGLSPSLVEKALGFVWSYQRYLGRQDQIALLQMPTFRFVRAANTNAYAGGQSRYAGEYEQRAV